MVDKPKKKTTKAKQQQGVLGGLPAERPARIGTRGARNGAAGSASARRKAAAPRTFEPTQAAETAATGNGSSEAAPAKPRRATGARRKAAAPRTFEPTQAAAAAAAEPPPPVAEPKPRPVRAAVPRMRTGDRSRQPPEPERTSGTQLVTNAVQAAGEVAQVGLTIGGQLLKRAFDRVPKP